MNGEQEQLNSKKADQLLEIYKLQTLITNNISNRRTTTNRYYIVVMSGMVFIFSTFLQNKDKLPTELLDIISIEWLVVTLGMLGIALSWAWCIAVDSYLRLNSRKYDALRELECKLEHQFFQREWNFLDKDRRDQSYRQLSSIELSVPLIFYATFTILLGCGVWSLPNGFFRLFIVGPVLLFVLFTVDSYNRSNNEERFNNDKMD